MLDQVTEQGVLDELTTAMAAEEHGAGGLRNGLERFPAIRTLRAM